MNLRRCFNTATLPVVIAVVSIIFMISAIGSPTCSWVNVKLTSNGITTTTEFFSNSVASVGADGNPTVETVAKFDTGPAMTLCVAAVTTTKALFVAAIFLTLGYIALPVVATYYTKEVPENILKIGSYPMIILAGIFQIAGTASFQLGPQCPQKYAAFIISGSNAAGFTVTGQIDATTPL
jgi:hypothetical protein